jgi:hypothetical protein
VTFIAPVLLTGTSSVTNNGPITFQSTVDGANDLTVNAGTGTTTFQDAVGGSASIGDGAGAALTIAGGAATFNGTVTARSGLTQAGTAGLVTFNENVSINAISGATPSTFNGNVTLSSMTFSTNSAVAGQGNVTFGDAASDTVTLAGGPSDSVTLQTTGSVANTILSTATVVDTTNTLLVLSAAPSTSAITFTAANTYNGVTRLDVGRFNLTGSLTGAGGEVRLNGANVIFNGGTTGIVEGAGRGVVANGTATSATVQNFRRIRNTASGGVGVRLAGGSSVRVIDNTGSSTADGISGSTINVQTNGGTLFLRGNKINAASAGSSIGLDILGGAVVDAGQDQGGYDFTGLGTGGVAGGSTGGNVFGESSGVGYTNTLTGFAIRNRSSMGANGAAGPQGAPADTYAQGNTFNGTTALSLFGGSYIPIENVVSHDFDNATWGFVNYVTNGLARPARITDADGEVLLFMTTGTAQANNSWDQRSMIRYLRISFNDFVFFGSGATQLTRNGGIYDATGGTFSGNVGSGRTGPVVFNPNPLDSANNPNSRYFNYDFEATGTNAREVSGSLVDGAYTFALNEARIQAFVDFNVGDFPALQVGTGTQSLNFHRLFGDFNGDQVTNTTDRTAFNAAFRSTFRTTNYREYFDFDADRDVDGGDQTQFNRRLDRY